MNGKSRLDYLVNSESQRQSMYGGLCCKLNAVFSSLLGIVVLVTSFLLFGHPRLQIHNYLGANPVYVYDAFPTILLGCAAATSSGSIVQIIGALMLLFEDITLAVWKWLKFTILMISFTSTMLLITQTRTGYGDIGIFTAYFVIQIINSIYCTFVLVCDLCCMRRQRQQVVKPY